MDKEDRERLQKQMTYNDDGEGVINGKTIREIEAENMKKAAENPSIIHFNSKNMKVINKERYKNRKKINKDRRRRFFQIHKELILGSVIALLFISSYFAFRTGDIGGDSSLLGGMLGGLGAIVSILLSITFSKRSNEQALDSAVLPFIVMKRKSEPAENYIAFEYISVEEDIFKDKSKSFLKRMLNKKIKFDFWRPFDFNTIKDDKITLVRNGIAYLHLENIGLGPAKNINVKINNFGHLFLEKNYLKPNEKMNIILNFSNPDDGKDADITIEYETIRSIKHTQVFSANITWHLDRTNFTLFS